MLECTDCEFQTTVAGEYSTAVDAGAEHRDAVDAVAAEHFVNVRRVEPGAAREA